MGGEELRVRVEEEGKRIVFWQAVANSWRILWGGYASPRVRTRISVCLLLPSESTTATPTITNGIIYEFEHEPELLLRKPLRRRSPTLLAFPEYRDWGVGTKDDLATFWNFIMIRLKLKMHNDAHGSHNNGDIPVNASSRFYSPLSLSFSPPSTFPCASVYTFRTNYRSVHRSSLVISRRPVN